jgi:hypothetical protein
MARPRKRGLEFLAASKGAGAEDEFGLSNSKVFAPFGEQFTGKAFPMETSGVCKIRLVVVQTGSFWQYFFPSITFS